MKAADWRRVRELFEQAALVPVEERDTWVEEACADDSTLRRELLDLLEADGQPEDRFYHAVEDVARDVVAASDERIAAGETVSHYRIEEELGAGGMGVVYAARDLKLNRRVALKFLPRQLVRDATARRRFVEEARSASGLDHPNICTIFEIDETATGQLFIAMALYQGETVYEKLFHGALAVDEAVDIARQVAAGLARAHERAIVHRDIKPANLIVTEEGLVKVLDFGIAKLAGGTGLTQQGLLLGTVDYLSPEQARGRGVDHRTDVWSLGVVLYEMLSGQKPFRGDAQMAVIRAILEDEPEPLEGFGSLQDVLERALTKDPEDRYPSMEALAADLGSDPDRTAASHTPTVAIRRRGSASIAVLPFADMSLDRDQEYFCDGMAEELIGVLGRIPGLRVVSRTSSFRFKGTEADARAIGRQLEAGTLLEGSVRKAADRIRIAARLIDATDGCELWSSQYDRQLEDVFAVQDEIAGTIVETLRLQLAGPAPRRDQPSGDDLEAYNLYLKGRYHWNKRTPEGLERSVGLFAEAAERQPSLAKAHVGLAEAYLLLGIYGLRPPAEVMPRAAAAAARSLEIDPTSGAAVTVLACFQAVYRWSWAEAEQEFRRALEIDPSSATAHHWYAMNYLVVRRRFDDAARELELALGLDPLSLAIQVSHGLLHYYAGRFEQAADEYAKALELDSRFDMAHFFLGQTLTQLGEHGEAVRKIRRAIDLSGGGSAEMAAALGHAHAVAGERREAEAILARLEQPDGSKPVSPSLLAQVYAGLSDTPTALDLLEQAREERRPDLTWVGVRPVFEPLRSEERFLRLLADLGLD